MLVVETKGGGQSRATKSYGLREFWSWGCVARVHVGCCVYRRKMQHELQHTSSIFLYSHLLLEEDRRGASPAGMKPEAAGAWAAASNEHKNADCIMITSPLLRGCFSASSSLCVVSCEISDGAVLLPSRPASLQCPPLIFIGVPPAPGPSRTHTRPGERL